MHHALSSAAAADPGDCIVRDLDTGEARPLSRVDSWIEPAADPATLLAPLPSKPPQKPPRPPRPLRTHRRRERPRAHSDLSGSDPSSAGSSRRHVGRSSQSGPLAQTSAADAAATSSSSSAASSPLSVMPPIPSYPVRVSAYKKIRHDFRHLRRFQRIQAAHTGAILCIALSPSGGYLASSGADGVVHVWELLSHNPDDDDKLSADSRVNIQRLQTLGLSGGTTSFIAQQDSLLLADSRPCRSFRSHTQPVTAMSWSKNDFLLTAGMDMTMRLWHPTSPQCLRRFTHTDFVTSVTFHPQDEQICVSGSADGTLRLFHLKENKLLSEAETDELITATTITPDGKMLVAGTICGRCKLYGLFDEIQGEWQLIHTTQMDVRSSRGKNRRKAAKINGITFSSNDPNEFMISSSDSRIRLYRMDDKSVVYKYTGHTCTESNLTGSISPGGRFVLSGSENRQIFIWEVDDHNHHLKAVGSKPLDDGGAGRRDRNASFESFVPHEQGNITAALFAQTRYYPRRGPKDPAPSASSNAVSGLVIITASDQGELCVFACL
jgi:WD repeat-containing protein 44